MKGWSIMLSYNDSGKKRFFHISFPVATTLILGLLVLFLILIPSARESLKQQKINQLRNLTANSWNCIKYYQSKAERGLISEKKAKEEAKKHLNSTHYGENNEGYFFVVDTKGKILVHPQEKLQGSEGYNMTDSEGKYFIVDFIKMAQENGEGVVEYFWPLIENPEKTELKFSYLKFFKPWGWIVGTGAYASDIANDIFFLSMQGVCAFIVLLFLLAFMIWHMLQKYNKISKAKIAAENALKAQDRKLRDILEALPAMIIRINNEGKIVDFKESPDFPPFVEPSEFLNKKLEESWPKDLLNKFMEKIRTLQTKNEIQNLIFEREIKGKSYLFDTRFSKCGNDELIIAIHSK